MQTRFKSSSLDMFLGKGVMKTCTKFTEEHPHRSAISIALRHASFPVELMYIFRTYFIKTLMMGCFCRFSHIYQKALQGKNTYFTIVTRNNIVWKLARGCVVYVIARLFRQCQTPQNARFFSPKSAVHYLHHLK